VAAIVFSGATAAIARGNDESALQQITWAADLDPRMALYQRQRGAALLLRGELEEAGAALSAATRTNPFDDTAWRALGLSWDLRGNPEAAERAYGRAVALQRSDATNLLSLLQSVVSQGNEERARQTAAEIVETWPQIVSAPGWLDLTGPLGTGAGLVDAALRRWERGEAPASEVSRQPLVLAGMVRDRDVLARAATESGLSHALATAIWSTYACRPDAEDALARTMASDRRITDFWLLRAQLAAMRGDRGTALNSLRVAELMGGASIGGTSGSANPLNENVAPGFSADVWGYRRPAVEWPSTQWDVPSWRVGRARWALEPAAAASTAGLNSCGLTVSSYRPNDTLP
jgi:tetratricopeptide (TPR) repeat protein